MVPAPSRVYPACLSRMIRSPPGMLSARSQDQINILSAYPCIQADTPPPWVLQLLERVEELEEQAEGRGGAEVGACAEGRWRGIGEQGGCRDGGQVQRQEVEAHGGGQDVRTRARALLGATSHMDMHYKSKSDMLWE